MASPKSQIFDDAAIGAADEVVGGFDVAVDDAALVHLGGAAEQLPHGGAHRGLGQRRRAAPGAGALTEKVVEAGPHELHDKAEGHGGRVASEAAEASDERVVAGARLEELRLPQQRGVAAEDRAEALDGDGTSGGAP